MNTEQILKQLHACEEAVIWANNRPINQVIAECDRGDWLLWLAQMLGVDKRKLTLAKGKCAETVIDLMQDERSKAAVKSAIDYGNGLINDKELAYAASAAYVAFNATTAASAAHAAHYAAFNAADAADAASAADAAADAAYAASNAADVAKKENELKTANICREILTDEILNKWNELNK